MKKLLTYTLTTLLSLSCLATFSSCKDSLAVTGDVKNVILVIADGTGENHIENAVTYFGIPRPEFLSDRKGSIGTYSLGVVTDSAAAATALATGNKVKNREIARHNGKDLVSISELALQAGKRVGVVTTDTLDGATPASFSSHADDRGDSEDIAMGQAVSNIDLLMGQAGSVYADYTDLFSENGYDIVLSPEALSAYTESEKLLATFPDVRSEYIEGHKDAFQLKEMAAFALDYLENGDGYFLMIESAYIDKCSHSNTLVPALCEARSLFDTLDYLYDTVGKDTAIIVTADHETGRLKKAASATETSDDLYGSKKHSLRNVPIFIKNFSFRYDGTPQNTAVFEMCKALLKL